MPPDPTLSRHDRRRPRQLTSGWFVDYGSEIKLRDRWGNTWSRESVSIVQGGFGYAEDGAQKVPRPFKYDGDKTVVEGDVVLIDFLDGNPKTPIVLGGVRSARATGFLSRGHQDETAPYNRLRFRLRSLDTDGNVTGDVRLEAHGDDGDGALRVSATAKLQLLVTSDLDGAETPIRLTVADGKVVVEAGGATEAVLLGETYTVDELAAMTQISSGLASMGLPVTDVASFILSLTGATTLGTPYLSQKLEAE